MHHIPHSHLISIYPVKCCFVCRFSSSDSPSLCGRDWLCGPKWQCHQCKHLPLPLRAPRTSYSSAGPLHTTGKEISTTRAGVRGASRCPRALGGFRQGETSPLSRTRRAVRQTTARVHRPSAPRSSCISIVPHRRRSSSSVPPHPACRPSVFAIALVPLRRLRTHTPAISRVPSAPYTSTQLILAILPSTGTSSFLFYPCSPLTPCPAALHPFLNQGRYGRDPAASYTCVRYSYPHVRVLLSRAYCLHLLDGAISRLGYPALCAHAAQRRAPSASSLQRWACTSHPRPRRALFCNQSPYGRYTHNRYPANARHCSS
jgi:hypothetical protein